MPKEKRIVQGPLPPELDELLRATRPVEEVRAELAKDRLNLDDDPEFVADRLKADVVEALLRALEKRGMNQNDLAERLNKSRQWVSRILNETDNFTLATIAKLASAVGMRPFINFADEGEVVKVTLRHTGPAKVEEITPSEARKTLKSKAAS